MDKVLEAPFAAGAAFLGFFGILVVLPLATVGFAAAAPYFGGMVGFIALVSGALLNAELNRRRDALLDRRETQAALMALDTELTLAATILTRFAEATLKEDQDPVHSLMFRHVIAELRDDQYRMHLARVMRATYDAEEAEWRGAIRKAYLMLPWAKVYTEAMIDDHPEMMPPDAVRDLGNIFESLNRSCTEAGMATGRLLHWVSENSRLRIA